MFYPRTNHAINEPGRKFQKYLLTTIISIHILLLSYSAFNYSPTLNEPGHLVAGISYLKYKSFGIYCVNPPLVRIIAACPVVVAGYNEDWSRYTDSPGSRPEYALGEDFVNANSSRIFYLITIARLACIPFSVIGCYICYRWASNLNGYVSGIVAATAWCFCPFVLSNGALITSDMAGASFGLLSSYSFWCWLKKPTWRRAVSSGVILGLAESCKTTLLILYPAWPLIWAIYRLPDLKITGFVQIRKEILMNIARLLISIYIINFVYIFEGTNTPLGQYKFSSELFAGSTDGMNAATHIGNRFSESVLGKIPVPLPKHFIIGIDLQRRDFEHYGLQSYLNGKFSDRGWWYYYIYGMALKMPIGTIMLFMVSTIIFLGSSSRVGFKDDIYIISFPLIIVVFVSSQTGFSEHIRYVLPAIPYIYIWISRRAVISIKKPAFSLLVATLMFWSTGSSISMFPHLISYFNEFTGGPVNGPNYLLGNCIDQGQDLLNLKQWIYRRSRPDTKSNKIFLAYYGSVDPRHAGIHYAWPQQEWSEISAGKSKPTPGLYAISVNFVNGMPRYTYTGTGGSAYIKRNELAFFKSIEPEARVGYSIYIYRISD